jgi:MFS family permease
MRELWLVFGYIVLSNLAYAMVNLTLTLWLSSDLGYGDVKAGVFVSSWSALLTLSIVMVGSLTDALGLRKTFLVGMFLCLFARAVMVFSTSATLAISLGMVVLAVGEAMGAPVTIAALRRYTTTAQRSIAYSIFYAIMNAGFFVAGYLFDFVRARLGGDAGRCTLPWLGIEVSTYRMIFLVSAGIYVPAFVIIYFWLREGAEATEEGVKIAPLAPKAAGGGVCSAFGRTIRDTASTTFRIFTGLWKQAGFYKFLGFLTLCAFVKMIFVHMNYTFPKFGIRELGDGAPIGKLWGLNPILIVFLAPLVGVLTQRISAYRMAVWGSLVAAGSVLIMAMPPRWFEPLADGWAGHCIAHIWLGLKGPVNPWYVMIFLFTIFLSIGEAIYSPRLYEYAAAIAPKGQEASYMALSQVPMFLAKIGIASFSGVLLANFCPASGPRHSGTLWLIIAASTMIAPAGLFLLQRFIRVHEAGRE